MKYTDMVTGLFDFIKGSVSLDKLTESPRIVPAEPPKPKEEPKPEPAQPAPAPAPTKESKGDDSLKECPVCKTMTVQRNEDPTGRTIWSCKNCGRQIENGEVVADGNKDRKVEPAKEGKDPNVDGKGVDKMNAEELIKSLYEEMKSDKAFMDSMTKVNEVAPPGWEPVVKKMKKHKEIETPWALVWWMKGKGYKPAKEGKDPNVDGKGVDKMSAEELIQTLYEDAAEEGKEAPSAEHDINKMDPAQLIQTLFEQHPEQFNVVARSLTDQSIAKDLATKHKGQVVPDSVDAKKFMVITKIGTTEQMGAGPYHENVDMKEAVKKRSRGKVVFPADSPKVKDDGDHFPINDVGQARNALSRAGQYSAAPAWYSGDLSSLKNAVRRAVKSAYPSIEVTEKIEDNDDLERRTDLLDEAKESLQECIGNIEDAIKDTELEDNAKAYLVDQLKIHVDSEHGFLSDDLNIETLKEQLEKEFAGDEGSTDEKKVSEDEVDAIDYSDEYRTIKIIMEDNIGRQMSDEQFNQVIASMKASAEGKELFEEQIKSLNDEILHFLMASDDHIHKVLGESVSEKMKVKKFKKSKKAKKMIKDGKIPDPNATDAEKIKDMTEHSDDAVVNALKVIVLDPKIKEWLEKNDPQALKQAEEAIASTGVKEP